MASQITSLTIAYSTVYSDADQRKQQSSRVTGLCAGNSPGTSEFSAQMASNAEMCPFDDVIMCYWGYGSRLFIQSVAFTGYERDSSFWMSIILLYLLSQKPYRIVLSTILRWFLHIDALHHAFACSLLVLCVAAPRQRDQADAPNVHMLLNQECNQSSYEILLEHFPGDNMTTSNLHRDK